MVTAFKKRGPAKLKPSEVRSVRKEVRFTREEWKRIEEVSAETGLETTTILRDTVLNYLDKFHVARRS